MSQISRQELAELTRRNDVVAAILLAARAVFHVGVSALALQVLAAGHLALGLLVLLPHLAAYSFLGWAGIGHELFHSTVFTSRAVNQFLFRLFSVLTWNNYFYFQASHPHHHRLTLAPEDPEGVRPARLDGLGLLQLLTLDVSGLVRRVRVLALNAVGRVPDTATTRLLFPAGSEARSRLCAGARVVLGSHLALLALFALTGAYWMILIVTLAPFCLTFFNRTLAAAQHFGLEGAGREYARSCRTVLLDPVTGFFYADMNFHVEHHYYPSVPHYNLRCLHGLLAGRIEFPHLTRGYAGALRELARHGLFPAR